jgi:two-component system chemotaxis sensor kinase CheA
MRVSAERLDDMMDRVGELVIAEARLNEIAARSGDPALLAVAEDIQRLATGMRDTTMSIRMTPLGSITGRFKRLVHDLSQALAKPIDLVLEGEETELDKTVVEQLADPLLHLIRNAADHGIEDPAKREGAGKPARGRVVLSARYSGAEVLIALSDDGRGLDAPRIRQKAQERGLIPPDADPPEAELFPLIFEPGFSTAPQVTELSGRGVGMDVVKRTVAKLRGSIDVASRPGEGTRVTLRLPLTLAIIDGLLVEVAGERFTIPLAAVDEIVELPGDSLGRDGGAHFLDIRGRLVPYLRLRALFESEGEGGAFQKVVVVTAGDVRVGLVVDRIVGSTQTVIKQLSPLHASLTIFSGATILGDGSVALILDVPNLVGRARGPAAEARRPTELAA